MKKLNLLWFLLLFSCSIFEDKDEKVKYLVYINSNELFVQPNPTPPSSYENGPGLIVENITDPDLIKSLAFKTSDGFVYNVPIDKIYNIYSTTGAGDTEPFEIPNREFTSFSISISDVIKKIRYNNDGTYTILEKEPISRDFDLYGFGGVDYMGNVDPYTSPSGKNYGPNSYVSRLDFVAYNDMTQSTTGTFVDNSFDNYDIGIYSTGLNPDKGSTALGGCLEGYWQRDICDGTQKAKLLLNDGMGSLIDVDCITGECVRNFVFEYTVISDTQVKIKYLEGSTICGEPSVPNGGIQNYQCIDENTLIFGNTYTKLSK